MSLLLVIVILVSSLIWLIRRRKWVNQVNKVPGTEEVPIGILGDTGILRQLFDQSQGTDVSDNLLRMLDSLAHAIPDTGLFRIWIGPMPHLIITDAEHMESVLSSNDLTTKGMQYGFLQSWLGLGLLTSSGDKWRNSRKMLTPSFHFKILEQFVPVMSKNGKILVSKLEAEAAANDGLISDLRPFILLCALDVICETAMGETVNAQSDPQGKYIKTVHQMGKSVIDRSFKPWTFNETIFGFMKEGKKSAEMTQVLHNFTDSVIKSRKQQLIRQRLNQNNNQRTNDGSNNSTNNNNNTNDGTKMKEPFLDALLHEHLANPSQFTELNIREEVDTFMFEGHDTTAYGVIWCTYLLGLHPEFQQRIQDEVDSLYLNKDDDDDELTLDELRSGLPFTEAAVKEAQRLYPSVPAFSRVTTKDETRIGKYNIPAGVFIVIVPTLVQHNSKYWGDDAIKFNPDRFMVQSNKRVQHPYAFVPFSAGPRNCIGQKFAMLEEKALIAKIFRKFNVTSLDHRDVVMPSASLIMKSVCPIRVRLQVRESESTRV